MSFNRPDYLARTAQSLQLAQEVLGIDLPTFLFQDGSLNLRSSLSRCDPHLTNRCLKEFTQTFSAGHIVVSPENIGVALNFDRAERLLFDDLSFDAAIFFEDDMVVDKRYLQAISGMLDTYAGDPRVGLLACYGANHQLNIADQVRLKDQLTVLTHFWAFAITRQVYNLRKPLIERYLKVVSQIDYMHKDRLGSEIHALHKEMGFPSHVISQDMFKCMAMHRLGLVSLNTNIVLGRYIGETGIHSNASHFAKMHYADTQTYPEQHDLPSFNRLGEEDFRQLLDLQDRYIHGSRPS